jgi:hypothetical protein
MWRSCHPVRRKFYLAILFTEWCVFAHTRRFNNQVTARRKLYSSNLAGTDIALVQMRVREFVLSWIDDIADDSALS